jgi:Flp pilus assembly pilin Flp
MLTTVLRRFVRDDSGMSTAEYAVGTIAAAAFAAVLYAVVTGSSVVSGLGSLIGKALSVKL